MVCQQSEGSRRNEKHGVSNLVGAFLPLVLPGTIGLSSLLARIIATFKHGHGPAVGFNVMAQDIQIISGTTDFEIAVIGIQPAIDHLGDLNQTLTKIKLPWGFLAAVSRIADHSDLEY
jgi:hypothetical protein